MTDCSYSNCELTATLQNKAPVADVLKVIGDYLHRPRSTAPGKTPGRHRDQTIVQPRSEHERRRWVEIRSIPSYFAHHGSVGVNSEMPTSVEPSLNGRHDGCGMDYATRRMSGRMTRMADDAEARSNMLTWLRRCWRIMGSRGGSSRRDDDEESRWSAVQRMIAAGEQQRGIRC